MLRRTPFRPIRLWCWWFGCRPNYEAERQCWEVIPCDRCGAADTSYSDRVGDTRHNRLMDWLAYWFWHRWVPKKCAACGAWFGHKSDCDGIPF